MSKHKLYSRRWNEARNIFLNSNPLCRMCKQAGLTVKADVVDHIVPHRGNKKLFWAVDNWQALCYACHNSDKQREERRGFSCEVAADGWPIDDRHPSNRK